MVRAGKLKAEAEMCYMSGVTCHVSGVTFHVSRVWCQVSYFFLLLLFFYKVVELVGGGSVINVAYPV